MRLLRLCEWNRNIFGDIHHHCFGHPRRWNCRGHGGILDSGLCNPDGCFIRCFLLQAFAVGSKKIKILDQPHYVPLRLAGRRTPPQLLDQGGLGL